MSGVLVGCIWVVVAVFLSLLIGRMIQESRDGTTPTNTKEAPPV